MAVSLLKKDNSRKNLLDVFGLMGSGEIYAPDPETGTGGEYIIQENRFVADPSGEVSDLLPFQQETGVRDYMTSQIAEESAPRLESIRQMTGANISGLENMQFDPAAVEKFKDMSTADRLAAQMVQTGQMNPKDFYATQKKAEVDKHRAMLDFFSKIDPQKSPVQLMSDGQQVPMTGENFMELMSGSGDVEAKIERPYPSVHYSFPGAGGGARGKYVGLRASKLSEAEKKSIAGISEGQVLLTNLVNTYKGSGYGGAGSIPGEKAAKIPLVGKHIAPKHAEYQKQKELASEVWLRAATGAATNPDEIKRYAGFLPDESDPPDLAQSKMENFFNKITAKVEGRGEALEVEAKGLESLGQFDLAKAKRTQVKAIIDLINQARISIPSITTPSKEKMSTDEDAVRSFLRGRKKK